MRRPLESAQYTSYAFQQVLDDHQVLGSIGSVGDAYDNSMAESFVDSFKTELIRDRVWRTRSQLELAIVEYVGWFNNDRLHGSLGDLPPTEFEALYAATTEPITSTIFKLGNHQTRSPRNPARLTAASPAAASPQNHLRCPQDGAQMSRTCRHTSEFAHPKLHASASPSGAELSLRPGKCLKQSGPACSPTRPKPGCAAPHRRRRAS